MVKKKSTQREKSAKLCFFRCESEFISAKTLNQKDCDYDLRSAPGRSIDALGTLTTHNNMELIIVEASR